MFTAYTQTENDCCREPELTVTEYPQIDDSHQEPTFTENIKTDNCQQDPLDYQQSMSEYVPQQEATVSVSAPAVVVNKSCSYTVQLQRTPENKNTKEVPSQQNIHLLQPHTDDANTDKKKSRAESWFTSQPNIHLPQPHKDDADTDMKKSRAEHRFTSQPNIHLLQPHRDDADTDAKKYQPEPLFVSDITSDTRLTIEDIYIEAMTLAAEIRIHRRQLDDKGWAELQRILKFCHNALHEKLVLNSLAKRAHGANRQRN